MRAKNRGPLRKIVDVVSVPLGRFGCPEVLREVLECGHVVRIRSDIIGETNAVRRRCRECAKMTSA